MEAPADFDERLELAAEEVLHAHHLDIGFDEEFAEGRRMWTSSATVVRRRIAKLVADLLGDPTAALDVNDILSTTNVPKLHPNYTPYDIAESRWKESPHVGTEHEALCYVMLGHTLRREAPPDVRADSWLIKRIEELESSLTSFSDYVASLELKNEQQRHEVERLQDQVRALQLLLLAQKAREPIDRGTLASVANTVLLVINSAVMAIGLQQPPQQLETIHHTVHELTVECVGDSEALSPAGEPQVKE